MTIHSLDILLSQFCTCSLFMSGSNCCFLTYIQASQEACMVVWHSIHLLNFPQFVVIHTVKSFSIITEAEVDFFLEFPCLFMIQPMLAIWSLVHLPFINPACKSGISCFMYCWSLAWRILSFTLLTWNEHNCTVVWIFFGIHLLWHWNENWPLPDSIEPIKSRH